MIDIISLQNALPATSLTSSAIGRVALSSEDDAPAFFFYEPPIIRQGEVFLEPEEAIYALLRYKERKGKDIKQKAKEIAEDFLKQLPETDKHHGSSGCGLDLQDIRIYALADQLFAYMETQQILSPEMHEYLLKAASMTESISVSVFRDGESQKFSFKDFIINPDPLAMQEFLPLGSTGEARENDPYYEWRKLFLNDIIDLCVKLGKQIYFYDYNFDGAVEDDYAHRFLVLHYHVFSYPDSPLTAYLLNASKAQSRKEFLSAMLDPASYIHPFLIDGVFTSSVDAGSCWFVYPSLEFS